MQWRSKIALAMALVGAAHSVRADTTFYFRFDNPGVNRTNLTSDGPIVPPLAGTGQFVSPTNLVSGHYDLATLPGFSMNFSFFDDGATFDQNDIITPLAGLAISIIGSQGHERLFFTESGGAGSDGGRVGGSLDLLDASGYSLTFEPTGAGGNFDYQKGVFNGPAKCCYDSGRYLAVSSPEPGSLPILSSGLVAILLIAIRRSRILFR
jgi:hypothetical protein